MTVTISHLKKTEAKLWHIQVSLLRGNVKIIADTDNIRDIVGVEPVEPFLANKLTVCCQALNAVNAKDVDKAG